jgi:predicted enzyme related to lactoylglutathione lyase
MKKKRRENRIDYLELPAPSVKALTAAKKFYSEVFGWAFQDWGPDYADTEESGLGSGINADPENRSRAPLAILFSNDLESARDRVKKAGGKITREIYSFPGGRRFHYQDPAGNELAVWSDE